MLSEELWGIVDRDCERYNYFMDKYDVLLSGKADLAYLSDADEDGALNYHDQSLVLAEKGMFKEALELCEEGVINYPDDITLKADILEYYVLSGEREKAEKQLANICEIDISKWNWVTYVYVLDYLMCNPKKNEVKCREFIDNFKKNIPDNELSYLEECRLEVALGNNARERKILEEALEKYRYATVSAIRLLDLQVKKAEYEEAKKTVNYLLVACNRPQPMINMEYFMYLWCQTESGLFYKKYSATGAKSENDLLRLKNMYNQLEKMPYIVDNFGNEIKDKIDELRLFEILSAE